MSAARELRVARVVLAGTMQVVWHRQDIDRPSSVGEAHPADHYALAKLWAEQMGEMYARCSLSLSDVSGSSTYRCPFRSAIQMFPVISPMAKAILSWATEMSCQSRGTLSRLCLELCE
jgi:hypothetical protein